jgi:hypothetical protein
VGVAFSGGSFVCGFNAAKINSGTDMAAGAADVRCLFYCGAFFPGFESSALERGCSILFLFRSVGFFYSSSDWGMNPIDKRFPIEEKNWLSHL